MTGQGALLIADSCGALVPNPEAATPPVECPGGCGPFCPPPTPREPQPVTSQLAADSVAPVAGDLRAQVLAAIRSAGERGLVDDEGEVLTGLSHQTYSARRRELAIAEAIRKSGERRRTRSGRTADVWVVA